MYWKVELTTDYLVWDVGDLNIKYQMSGVVSSIMDENIRSWWLAWVVILNVKYEICGSKFFFRQIELSLAGQTVAYLQLPLKEVSADCSRSSPPVFFVLIKSEETNNFRSQSLQAQTLSSLPALSTFYRF